MGDWRNRDRRVGGKGRERENEGARGSRTATSRRTPPPCRVAAPILVSLGGAAIDAEIQVEIEIQIESSGLVAL
jgi:hypothetical protein